MTWSSSPAGRMPSYAFSTETALALLELATRVTTDCSVTSSCTRSYVE